MKLSKEEILLLIAIFVIPLGSAILGSWLMFAYLIH